MTKIQKILASFLILSASALAAGAFDNDLNHSSDRKITKVQICGERCTGTNFIRFLIERNFNDIYLTAEFGWKHFLWWFGFPVTHELEKDFYYSKFFSDPYYLTNSEDCLFVVVVRDPYDWVRSFYLLPWHLDPSVWNSGFSHFIRSTVNPEKEGKDGKSLHEIIDGINPWTGNPFQNLFELRHYKNLNYIKLGSLVDNYIIAKYEAIQDNPEGFIDFVADNYQMTQKPFYTPIIQYKGGKEDKWPVYKKKKYAPISKEDMEFINRTINWTTENLFGYFPKEEVQ